MLLRVAPPPSAPDTVLLPGGRLIPIAIRRSKRARRIAIRIKQDCAGVDLVVPERAPLGPALAFLDSRRAWIADRLAHAAPSIPFAEGAVIPILGRNRTLRACAKPAPGRRPFHLDEDELVVAGRPEHIARRTRDGMMALAREELKARVLALAPQVGHAAPPVTIGDPRSRWGSCSSRGTLRFSWRLVLAPVPVIDYVVAHEVAHLQHLNHSPAFWALVAELCPDFAAQRAWLRRHGQALMRYGTNTHSA
jgi:predicted metal-dependent hydrolase